MAAADGKFVDVVEDQPVPPDSRAVAVIERRVLPDLRTAGLRNVVQAPGVRILRLEAEAVPETLDGLQLQLVKILLAATRSSVDRAPRLKRPLLLQWYVRLLHQRR